MIIYPDNKVAQAANELTNVALQSYFSYKALFYWLNLPAYFSNVFLVPVLRISLFAFAGKFVKDPNRVLDYVLGMSLYTIPWILIGGVTQSFYYERELGTVPVILGSTCKRYLLYLSKVLFHLPNALISFTVSLAFGIFLFGRNYLISDWFTIMSTVVAVLVSGMGFALFLGSIVLILFDWLGVFSVTAGSLIVLTGIVVPVDALPIPLKIISNILPLTRGIAALRGSFHGTIAIALIDEYLLGELYLGIFYGFLGYVVFRVVETVNRKSGRVYN